MSSDDCFELGRQSYVNRDYYHTVLWMNEAMARMLEEPHNQTQSFTRADLLEYLAFSTYKQGKYTKYVTSCLWPFYDSFSLPFSSIVAICHWAVLSEFQELNS